MADFEKLICDIIELEGAVRVLSARTSEEALTIARRKLAEIEAALNEEAAEPVVETPEPVEKPIVVSEPVEVAVEPAYHDLRKLLTLNDKFMFRRELFDNNDEEFNATIDLLSAMHSLDEVEEYLYYDLAWDRENPTVVLFHEFVARAFNEEK
ncbi:MAG: hypothetical protein ACI30X_05750 [Muribaculaceae bacterium]